MHMQGGIGRGYVGSGGLEVEIRHVLDFELCDVFFHFTMALH